MKTKKLLLTGLLGVGLMSPTAMECFNGVGKMLDFPSFWYVPAVASAIGAVGNLAMYFGVKNEIKKSELVAQRFALIKTTIDNLSGDSTAQAINSLNQSMSAFESAQEYSAATYKGYALLRRKLNDTLASYQLHQNQAENISANDPDLRGIKRERIRLLKEATNKFFTKHQTDTVNTKKLRYVPLIASVLLGACAVYCGKQVN